MSIPVAGVCTQPDVGEQASSVHASPSSHGIGPLPAHVPASSVVVVVGAGVDDVLLDEVVEIDVVVLPVVVVGGRDVDDDVEDVAGAVVVVTVDVVTVDVGEVEVLDVVLVDVVASPVVEVDEAVVVVLGRIVVVVVVLVVVVVNVVVGTVAANPPIWMMVSFAPLTASDVLTKTSFPVRSSKATPTGGATKPEAKSDSMGRVVPSVGRCVVWSIGRPVPGSIVRRWSSPKL
jgi:hypothetical protein